MQSILHRLVHAPILQRDDIGVDDSRHGDQAAAAQARQGTHDIEDCHGRCEPAAQAPEHERAASDEEHGAAAQQVGKTAVQRLEGRAGYQVRGREPHDGVGGVERGPDHGVRGCRDGTVEAREEDVAKDCYAV